MTLETRMTLKTALTRPTLSDEWGPFDEKGRYYFIDNGANTLAVAHLDYVLWANPKRKGEIVYAPQLDDRLGAWIITTILPEKFGVKSDILLTLDEEKCSSTGANFIPPRQYNWMYQFDRAGTDLVMYQYLDSAWADTIAGYGFSVSHGSYSDIADINIGRVGFNVGVGYKGQHTPACYANFRTSIEQAEKFARFHEDYADVPMPFDYDAHSYTRRYYFGTNGLHSSRGKYYYDDDIDDEFEYAECVMCSDWFRKSELILDAEYSEYWCSNCYNHYMGYDYKDTRRQTWPEYYTNAHKGDYDDYDDTLREIQSHIPVARNATPVAHLFHGNQAKHGSPYRSKQHKHTNKFPLLKNPKRGSKR